MKETVADPSSLSLNSRHSTVSDNLQGVDVDWVLMGIGDEDMAVNAKDREISTTTVLRYDSDQKIKYRIMTKDDMSQLLAETVSRVSTDLSLSQSEVLVLLQHFNWNEERALYKWRSCEEEVRKAAGLLVRKKTCRGCGETNDGLNCWLSICCGHQLCLNCWTEYTSDAINKGPECLALRCPFAPCKAAVGPELIELVSSKDDKKKFDTFLIKSFITGSEKGKWGPAPGFEFAKDSRNLNCQCLNSFCLECADEVHDPVQWDEKGVSAKTEPIIAANVDECLKDTSLTLNRSKLKSHKLYDFLSNMPNIRRLRMTAYEFGISFCMIAELLGPKVVELALDDCLFQFPPSFLPFGRLESLSLARIDAIDDEVLGPFLVEHGLKLKDLNISYCCDLTGKTLHSISVNCNNLEKLNTSGLFLRTSRGLLHLSGCADLKELIMTEIGLSDKSIANLVDSLPRLEKIDLSRCINVDSETSQALARKALTAFA